MGGFWPWHLGPLGAQLTGAWLIAFAVAAALVARERDLARLAVPGPGYATVGILQLAVLVAPRDRIEADAASLWAYVLVLATVVPAGGYGWWAGRARRR